MDFEIEEEMKALKGVYDRVSFNNYLDEKGRMNLVEEWDQSSIL